MKNQYRVVYGEPFHPHDYLNAIECKLIYYDKLYNLYSLPLNKINDSWVLEEWNCESNIYPIIGELKWTYKSGLEVSIECVVLPNPRI